MKTSHNLIISDSRKLPQIPDNSVDLVVTSPPYPMIQMWDELYTSMSKIILSAGVKFTSTAVFEYMHRELDKVWKECDRVLKPGSFACINIGDAVRTLGGRFQLYPNHSRIIEAFQTLCFDVLPMILWRKQTNAPNKFMGSGMLPAGAYVTLEHEYILIFRKYGQKRNFKTTEEKSRRMKSAFFWEERNQWFSDVWDFKGASQKMEGTQKRSASFPFELPYRLINMYSLYGDVVLDPFLGTGVTSLAAIACGRNSIGVEIDGSFSKIILEQEKSFLNNANAKLSNRVINHKEFISSKEPTKYRNKYHDFSVLSKQETEMQLFGIKEISEGANQEVIVSYGLLGGLCEPFSTYNEIEKITRKKK